MRSPSVAPPSLAHRRAEVDVPPPTEIRFREGRRLPRTPPLGQERFRGRGDRQQACRRARVARNCPNGTRISLGGPLTGLARLCYICTKDKESPEGGQSDSAGSDPYWPSPQGNA